MYADFKFVCMKQKQLDLLLKKEIVLKKMQSVPLTASSKPPPCLVNIYLGW